MEKKTMKIKNLTDLYPGLYITILKDDKLEILKLIKRRGRAFESYYSNIQSEDWSVSECYHYFKDLSKNKIYDSTRMITFESKTQKTRRAGITEIYSYKITNLSEELKYKEMFHGDDNILEKIILPFN